MNKQSFTCSAKHSNQECPLYIEWLDSPDENPMGSYSEKYKAFICEKCGVYTGYVIDENGDYVKAE